jgi:membrane protein required for colicin V production
LIGGVFGLCQGALLLAVVLFALSLRPLPWGMGPVMKEAYLSPPFVDLGGAVLEGSQRVLK